MASSTLPEGGRARRVYLLLRDEINAGRYRPGSFLPGEQRLAEIHGVSRVTVRSALGGLAADGLIEKRAGAGSVVRDPAGPEAMSADMATLIPQIVTMGAVSDARLLSFGYGAAPDRVAAALRLGPGARVQIAERLRLAEGRAFSHLTTYVPEDIARHYSEADLATTPLFRLLERSGVTPDRATQTVTAALASPAVAEALGIAAGSALMSLTRVVRDVSGRGVEYLAALYRPDLFRLKMDLVARRGDSGHRHWEPVIGATPPEDMP